MGPVTVPALYQNNWIDARILISMFDFAIWVWPAGIFGT